MERVPKSKPLPSELPTEAMVTSTQTTFFKKEIKNPPTLRGYEELASFAPARAWKRKGSLQDKEKIMPDIASFELSGDSFEEIGSTSFHGVSHPPEPADMEVMKGPFMEDLSIQVPSIKPSPSLLSPAESLVEEPNDLWPISSPFLVPRPSENTDASLLADSEEKECIWDASLPPSSNVSPHSSINSYTSTKRSDGIMCDGMLSVDRIYASTKGSFRGDSLESTKTSISRASDSSGLSDDSSWSNITGSGKKPHKGNDPRWKAIPAIQSRDGILGTSHFRLLKRLGCGDIGSVYLSELSRTRCFFAMKVMDKASLASRNKLTRAQTEREILQLLDHPFLPTLFF